MNLREKQAKQTYENIILTTEKLLEDCAYEELSVNHICEAAGLSKGGFYHHFSSKEQLMSLMIGRQMGNLISQRLKPCLNKKSAFELLEIYMDTTIEFLENTPKDMLPRCWVALAEHSDMTNDAFAMEYFQLIYKIVEQGKEEGTIRAELDNEFCQSYLNGSITGIVMYGSIFKDHNALQEFAADSLKLIRQAIS